MGVGIAPTRKNQFAIGINYFEVGPVGDARPFAHFSEINNFIFLNGQPCVFDGVELGHFSATRFLLRFGFDTDQLFDVFDELTVIAGNIATRDAAQHIVDVCNKDERSRLVLKVGVGGGSVCTTRIQTGCGIPTFQSVIDTAHFGTIVADGGLKTSGDIVKALAAGSSAVMLGSLLSGTEETPGEPRLGPGGLVKPYRGSASSAAKKAFYGKAEYIEGEETTVPYKGDTSVVINSVLEGIRSGLTYCGSRTIEELWENAEFVKITAAGFAESKPHLLGS